jgi:tight adherence protein B
MELDPRTMMMAVTAMICVGGVLLALFGIDDRSKTERRVAGLAGAKANAKAAAVNAPDAAKERRRHVTESLKNIEERQKQLKKQRLTLPQMIAQAGFDFSVRDFYMLSAIAGLVMLALGLATGQQPQIVAMMGIVGAAGLPRWYLGRARKKRQKKFANEFSNAIDVIVRGVKSGLPVNECLKIISRDAQSPVKEEFHLLTEGIRLGLSLEQSLERMYQRMPINEVNFFSIVLIIQKQTGGNLADALGNLSGVLRSRKMMLGKISALSMEAKASAVILAAMPFFVSGMVYLSAPDYLAPLYTTTTGQFMLIAAAVWMMIGVIVMKSMISIKV